MADRLFLSFWDLCLDNLPQGRFERRVIAPVDAGAMIRTARTDNKLLCVSKDDLLAPCRATEQRSNGATKSYVHCSMRNTTVLCVSTIFSRPSTTIGPMS